MKGQQQFDRTKVVLRNLPPTISKAALLERINSSSPVATVGSPSVPARTGKSIPFLEHTSTSRGQRTLLSLLNYLRAMCLLMRMGIQFKTTVEYAPSQRVPKQWSKKDGREGTINKDSEYLEFLEFLAKPAENLPSAEKQLERREAERAEVII